MGIVKLIWWVELNFGQEAGIQDICLPFLLLLTATGGFHKGRLGIAKAFLGLIQQLLSHIDEQLDGP